MSGKQGHTVGGLQGSEKRGQCHHVPQTEEGQSQHCSGQSLDDTYCLQRRERERAGKNRFPRGGNAVRTKKLDGARVCLNKESIRGQRKRPGGE